MNLRPIKDTDNEALLALWNRNAPHDPLTPALLSEKIWEDNDYQPDLALAAEDDSGLAGFIVGVLRQKKDGLFGYVKLIAVGRERQSAGVGSRLLQRLEKELFQRGAIEIRIGESAPNYLCPGLDPRYTRAMLFFQKHGYQRFGETWNMDAALESEFPTAEQESALAAGGIEVRRAAPEDEPAIMAFLVMQWPPWIDEVSRAMRNAPATLHIAVEKDAVVGFGAYDANNLGTGWFGPMGTAPETRGKGIGAVLLRRCLNDIRAQGQARAIIPWVGPIAFYTRHTGAEIARVFYRYRKEVPA